jgi:serine/threonine-protein phosphatase 2A activator
MSFDPNSLLPRMPSSSIQQQQQQQPVPVLPNLIGRRLHLNIVANGPFCPPTKQITNQEQLTQWTRTEAYLRLLEFLQQLNEAVKNKKLTDTCTESNVHVQS